MVIMNLLFVGWNFVGVATNNEDDLDNAINQGSEPRNSSNGVFNWSQIGVLSEPVAGQNFNTGDSGDTAIAVENDKIYVVWHDLNNTNGAGTDTDIFFRYFDGNIWSNVQIISEPVFGQNICTGYSNTPDIAVENGNIYVVWSDENNTNGCGGGPNDFEIFYRCNLTGSGWGDIQVISEPVPGQNINTGNSFQADIAVENGEIYVVWQDPNDTNGAGSDLDIFYRCNLTGTSWEDIQVISEPVHGQNFNTGWSGTSEIAVDNNKIYVVWSDQNDTNGAGIDGDIFYRCNLTGSGWEPIQVISEPVTGQNINTADTEFPSIAVESGKIYVVWGDGNNTNGAGTDGDIFYRSNLTGISWEDVQVISEPEYGQDFNTGVSWIPKIAVEKGKIYVVWTDENNTNGAGTDYDLLFRWNLIGTSWEDVEVVSESVVGQNSNTGAGWTGGIAVKNGKVNIVWHGYNNTNGAGTDLDVFYRWIQVPISSLFLRSPKVTPVIGNTSTEFNFTVIYNQLNNTSPTRMKVIIDDIEYSMLEVDSGDINYTNGKKYFFKIKYLDIGTHSYEFNASDGINYTNSRLFGNLKVVNTGPLIKTENNLTAIEDEYYLTEYEFEDIDMANVGQTCHWEFATNASWLNFNLTTGELNGTPGNGEVGEYWVYIAVNDTSVIVDTNFTLTVIDVNDKPIIITSNVEVTNEDELYEVDYDAADIDSSIEHQTWILATNATLWLNISSITGILNGTPGNDDVGEYWINVSVNDAEDGIDFTNYTLIVHNVNDEPEIITKDILIAETDKLYEADFNATDIDSPLFKQTWILDTNATWLLINSSTGLISGIPTRDDEGHFYVNVSVFDGNGGYDWHEFILRVLKGNLPPTITTVDVEIAMVNKTYDVDYNATDDKPSVWLTWSFETNASWLELDTLTGILTGIPMKTDGGKLYWVNISVSDSDNARAHHNFTLTVLKEPIITITNNIPRLSNFQLIPLEGDTNTEFKFSLHYFDADNEIPAIIQLVIDGIAYNMTLKPGEIPYSGHYEFSITLSEGEHTYYFTASDGSDSNTSEFFTTPKISEAVKQLDKTRTLNSFVIIATFSVILIVIITTFIGGTEVGKIKFLTIFFVPLYNRLHPENILNNYNRGQIHGYIKAKPGENYSSIKKALELNNGTLAHHAKVLEKEGYIYSKHDGFRTRFYPKGTSKTESDTLKQNLIDIIRQQPGISQREIISLLNTDSSQQVLSYNLIKLTRDGTIKLEHNGRENRYSINYEETDSYPDQDQHQDNNSVQSPPSIQPQQGQEAITSKQTLPQLPPSESGHDQDTYQGLGSESTNENKSERDGE
jgi:predicted transcriptional regulator